MITRWIANSLSCVKVVIVFIFVKVNRTHYTYKELSRTQIKTLEQQKIFAIINDEKLDDEAKVEQFGKSFIKITELTVDVISDCISKIETPDGATTDKKQIKEFINNCSKDVFENISRHLQSLKEQIELKAQQVHCEECGTDYEVPVTMDQSNFFDVKS